MSSEQHCIDTGRGACVISTTQYRQGEAHVSSAQHCIDRARRMCHQHSTVYRQGEAHSSPEHLRLGCSLCNSNITVAASAMVASLQWQSEQFAVGKVRVGGTAMLVILLYSIKYINIYIYIYIYIYIFIFSNDDTLGAVDGLYISIGVVLCLLGNSSSDAGKIHSGRR